MVRKYQIFKLVTVLALLWLFIVILLNIFNSGKSYYYIHMERKLQMQQFIQNQPLYKSLTPENNYKLKPPSATFIENKMDLKLDYNVREPSSEEFLAQTQKEIPSLPIEYFQRHRNTAMQKFVNCAQYPAIQVLNFYNTYWQTFFIDDSTFQLYGAYYDERPSTGPVIRILALTNHQQNNFPIIYCQLWFEQDSRPVLTTVKDFDIIWDTTWGMKPGVYYPYLMTCNVPQNINITGDPVPKVVNLVRRQCDTATNSLRVIYEQPKSAQDKKEFAVCVKGLDFLYEDLSARLIEWLELLKILGVHKVYMHYLQAHPNIRKVLNYYQAKGFVEVQNITLVGGVVGQPHLEHFLIKSFRLNKRLNELIPYNACFYRNLYKYDYIALLDIDEIIMPKGTLKSWQYLVASAQSYELNKNYSSGFASLCASNVYFPTKLSSKTVSISKFPSYMFMLNNVYRLSEYSARREHTKCLHSTKNVRTLHNHIPISYSSKSCIFDFSTSIAQLQHYRLLQSDNKEIEEDVSNLTKDNNMERFQKPLIERCTKALRDLDFLG